MTPRATPMSPDDRRTALVEATLPLLLEHGRSVTTKQIAEAAGVAEGTIFRAFENKDELVEAAIRRGFEPRDFVDRVAAIPRDAPLRDRLLALVEMMQTRFTESFGLMRAIGMVAPPEHLHTPEHARQLQLLLQAMIEVVRPDQTSLRVPAAYVVHVLRLLTFSGSHAEIARGQLLSAEDIVDIVMYGVHGGDGSLTGPTTTEGTD